KRGSIITLYFYATNCKGFLWSDGSSAPIVYGYQAMNWPNYLVWDTYQENFILEVAIKPFKINIVGPIWMQGKLSDLPNFDKKAIAVFDITPMRDSFYSSLALDLEYYIPETCNQLIKDCYTVVDSMGYLLIHKKKRNIGSLVHPAYRKLVESIDKKTNVITVNPDTSALKVIESSFAVISMPFTSTALIARELGKPSVFYDPSGLIQKDDTAAHGIPILSGQEELKDWMSNLVNDKTI
ncbi:MAG: polysaccharide biosynthesis PFTS motif protein, partial [Flavobacteriales bacterium]|nr:polysaccharide biosynthesis PFTS motif protein [Flavobacteriales bacterium]